MHEVSLAFLWHQHQPYYPDDVSGENPMPWVRLHGTKDYWGMAMLLKEVPEVHATINLVPSLVYQLTGYTERGHEDQHLRVSRVPADDLSWEDTLYLLDNFFMVHVDQMIRPYPRYLELYQKRGIGVDAAPVAAKRFTPRDIRDLQCWSNLTWFHPLAFEQDKDLAAFRKKGRHFSEDEKLWLLDKQMELLREVVPLHAELAKAGQVELTTTPFYHPILPLLWDKRLARQAMPDVTLPTRLEGYPEDARRHIRRGVEFHEQQFGVTPRGMWPSEGSVCQEVIPAIAEAGIEWVATDEEILSCSTNGWVSRDGAGFMRNPEMLYRPWRVEEGGKSLQIIFRDHAMSDQIGFHYQRYEAKAAVDDFLGKLHAIGHAAGGQGGRPPLVSIILDGENCWEYYPGGGVDFLRTLYRRIASHSSIHAVGVSEYLEEHPATDKLGQLFAGSWISHNFGIWIGHPECNRAWDALSETREYLQQVTREKKRSPQQIEQAWEELYIAEGSDWFWWFGDDHSSAQDGLFDRLFRKHLQNVYTALGDEPPHELARPISQSHHHPRQQTQPEALLDVKVDGRRTYFEWAGAGHYASTAARGTMTMAGNDGWLSDMYFGFDEERLLLRLDTHGGPARERLADIDTLRLVFYDPEGYELLLAHPGWSEPIVQLYHRDVPVSESNVAVAVDAILEMSIPLKTLELQTDDPLRFSVEVLQRENSLERLPADGAIETIVPSPDYELMMWHV